MKKIVPADAILIPDTAKRVFQGQIFDVYQWPQELYDGSHATFEMLRRPDSTAGIGIVEGKLLVVNDVQPGRQGILGFPGGRADVPGESVKDAVKREVREETGYEFAHWRLIEVTQPQVKLEWFVHVSIAWDVVRRSKPKPDAGEKLTQQLLTLAEVKRLSSQRIGFMGESQAIFERVHTIDDLLALPEFTGKTVDRD